MCADFVAVHDMFNWLTVIILLPLEAASGYLYHLTAPMVRDLSDVKDTESPKFLKVITDPLTNYIVAVSIQPSLAFMVNSAWNANYAVSYSI